MSFYVEGMFNIVYGLAAAVSEQSFSVVTVIEDIYESLGLPLPDPTIAGQVFGIATVAIFVLLFLMYAFGSFFTQKIFRKLGVTPSWSAWIPVYGWWKFFQAGKQQWWLVFIPVLNLIFALVAAYHIGLELRKGGGYVAVFIFFPWLWLILLSSKRVTAISVGTVNEDYVPPVEPEATPNVASVANSGGENGGSAVSSMVTDPTAAATAVATAATAGLADLPDADPNNEAAGVKPEAPKEKSLNPFPEESAFEKRQAEEKAKELAEIEAANSVPLETNDEQQPPENGAA